MSLSVKIICIIILFFTSSCDFNGKIEVKFRSVPIVISNNIYMQNGVSTALVISGGQAPYSYEVISGHASLSGDSITANSNGNLRILISDVNNQKKEFNFQVVDALSFQNPISGSPIPAAQDETFLATGGVGAITYSAVDELSDWLDSATGILTRPWKSGIFEFTATDNVGMSVTESFELDPRSFHHGGTEWEESYVWKEDSDGNLIYLAYTNEPIAGYTNAGSADYLLRKMDKDGSLIWQKPFGSSVYDWESDYLVTTDGDIYLAIQSSSNWVSGDVNIIIGCNLIKISGVDGQVLWAKGLSATTANRCRYSSLVEGDSGFIYMTGLANGIMEGVAAAGTQDAFLYKINPTNGATVWFRFSGTAVNYFASVQYDSSDQSIYFSAVTDGTYPGEVNTGGRDLFISRYDINGNRIWHDQWGHVDGWSHYWNRPEIINGKLVMCGITGQTWPQSNYYPVVLIYNKSNGVLENTTLFSEVSSDGNYPYPSCHSHGDGLLTSFNSDLAPSTFSASGNRDLYYYKYDMSGVEITKGQYENVNGSIRGFDSNMAMYGVLDSDADLANNGNSNYDTFIFKMPSLGDPMKFYQVGMQGATIDNHYWNDLYISPADNLFLTISSDGTIDGAVNQGQNDAFLLKFNASLERQ